MADNPDEQRIDAARDAQVAGRDQYINIYPVAGQDGQPTGGAGAGLAVLRAPTGRLPEHVRGRDDLLDRLAGLLARPDGRVHVLAGLGGTGKSTVALRLAEEAASREIPAWWVPAVGAETMTAKLLDLAAEIGAPPGEVAQAKGGQRNPADLLWRYLERRTSWLLIFDNADDPGVLTVDGADAATGSGWLRPARHGLIVVTSRNRDWQTWGRHAQVHPIGWLDAATGGQVLTDLAPHAGTAQEAAALAERLGGLPLALHHAGSQLGSEFATEGTFRGYRRALDERFGTLMGGRPTGDAADRAIVTHTWELSLDAVASAGAPEARLLLPVLCCLAPAVIIPGALLDLAVLARACDHDRDRAAAGLRALSSVGLITPSAADDGARAGVSVHPLVAETSRLRLSAADRVAAEKVAAALLVAATDKLDAEKPTDWPAWTQLVPHLNTIFGTAADELPAEDLAELASATAQATRAFAWGGAYATEEELARLGLRHASRLGPEHREVLQLRFWVANALNDRGQSAEAERELRALVADQRQALGPDDSLTLTTRHQFASVLSERGDHEQAELEYRRIHDARSRALGPEHPTTLAVRYEIARVLAGQGHHEEAEQGYREVYETEATVLGPEHPSTLSTRHAIAYELSRQGDHRQAEQEYRQVLDARARVLGAEHPETLSTRHELGYEITEQGGHQEAEQRYREVLDGRIRVLGPEHPNTLSTRHEIARMLFLQGQRDEADRQFRALLDMQLRVLGAEHPSTRVTQQWVDYLSR